jgi:hypothetical protein
MHVRPAAWTKRNLGGWRAMVALTEEEAMAEPFAAGRREAVRCCTMQKK